MISEGGAVEACKWSWGAATRSPCLASLVFKLSSGSAKARYGDTHQALTRFVYLTSTNTPLAAVVSAKSEDLSTALLDRLMTIPLAGKRPW